MFFLQKKWSPRLIFFNEFFFWKNSVDFWHRKLTLKVQFRHFLTNHNSSQDCFKTISFEHVDSCAKSLDFKTHHLINSTNELTLRGIFKGAKLRGSTKEVCNVCTALHTCNSLRYMPFGRARDLDMYDICATECQIFVKYGINVLTKIPHMSRFYTICIYDTHDKD